MHSNVLVNNKLVENKNKTARLKSLATTHWWTLCVLASWPSTLDKTKRFSWLVFLFCQRTKKHTHTPKGKKKKKKKRVEFYEFSREKKNKNVAISSVDNLRESFCFVFFAQPCNASLLISKRDWKKPPWLCVCVYVFLSIGKKSIICVCRSLVLHLRLYFTAYPCEWFKVLGPTVTFLPVTCIMARYNGASLLTWSFFFSPLIAGAIFFLSFNFCLNSKKI